MRSMSGSGAEASHLAQSSRPDPRQNVPQVARYTKVTGWLLMGFAGLVLANTAVVAATRGATGADWSFAVLVAMVAGASARSLASGARWAWWTALSLACAGLFFVLPVTGTILLGGALEPVGTGWDIVFFPVSTITLLALLAALRALRRAGPGGGSVARGGGQ